MYFLIGRTTQRSAAFSIVKYVRPSVCPSHLWVIPNRFKISKYTLHHTMQVMFLVSRGQISQSWI